MFTRMLLNIDENGEYLFASVPHYPNKHAIRTRRNLLRVEIPTRLQSLFFYLSVANQESTVPPCNLP